MSQEHTEVWIERVKANELAKYQSHGPLFVADSDPTLKPADAATIFRKVSSTSELWGYVGDRAQITVEFADGTPGRVFDMEDVVDVLNIVPGADFSTYRGGS